MARKTYSWKLVCLAALFCVALIVSNIVAGKLIIAPFGLTLTAAVWLFPVVYIIGDVVPEVYGLETARKIILLGFVLNAIVALFFWLVLVLPFPPFWDGQEAFKTVLGLVPRLVIASFAAYLVGTNLNAWVLVKIKALTNGKWLWMRTIGSTIVGELVDSAIFVTIAFYGSMPLSVLLGMILAQATFKTTYEIVATPLTYVIVKWFKREEGIAY